jgi:CRP/FNR family transcriptional regulator, anaerobic regulatory protein
MFQKVDSLSELIEAHDPVVPGPWQLPCTICHSYSSNFCGVLFGRTGRAMAMRGKHRAIAARQNIYRAGEVNEGLLVICDGWAVRFVQLPNGKRQILSVLLPGDLVSPTSMLEGQLDFSIQAVTDVRYCYFPFAEVRAKIRSNPSLFDVWLHLTAAEQRDADRRLVDLGQRTAQERIAALILHVMQRCQQRGELVDDEFPFPLSQQQIADFTGLTPVHTCRVLSSLRKNAVCDVGHGFIKILDRGELQRMGSAK